MEISFDTNSYLDSAKLPELDDRFPTVREWYGPGYNDDEGNWCHWLNFLEFGYTKDGVKHILSRLASHPLTDAPFQWHWNAERQTYGYFDENKNWVHWKLFNWPLGYHKGDELGYFDANGNWNALFVVLRDCPYDHGNGEEKRSSM